MKKLHKTSNTSNLFTNSHASTWPKQAFPGVCQEGVEFTSTPPQVLAALVVM
jgi:hypothetical protein